MKKNNQDKLNQMPEQNEYTTHINQWKPGSPYPEKELVSPKTLSQILDVPIRTIRTWIYKRKVRYYKIGKSIRFNLEEIRAWYKSNAIEAIKPTIINDRF